MSLPRGTISGSFMERVGHRLGGTQPGGLCRNARDDYVLLSFVSVGTFKFWELHNQEWLCHPDRKNTI